MTWRPQTFALTFSGVNQLNKKQCGVSGCSAIQLQVLLPVGYILSLFTLLFPNKLDNPMVSDEFEYSL